MDLVASLYKAGKTVLTERRPSNESVEQASQEKKKMGSSAPTPTQDVELDQVLFLNVPVLNIFLYLLRLVIGFLGARSGSIASFLAAWESP